MARRANNKSLSSPLRLRMQLLFFKLQPIFFPFSVLNQINRGLCSSGADVCEELCVNKHEKRWWSANNARKEAETFKNTRCLFEILVILAPSQHCARGTFPLYFPLVVVLGVVRKFHLRELVTLSTTCTFGRKIICVENVRRWTENQNRASGCQKRWRNVMMRDEYKQMATIILWS